MQTKAHLFGPNKKYGLNVCQYLKVKRSLKFLKISKKENVILSECFLLRPSQGFWGTGETGHLFQGNMGTKAKF